MITVQPHIKFRTSPQEHEFGYPYQMGHLPSADGPHDCMLASVRISRGDIVILGSDGLWDNIFDREIAATAVRTSRPRALRLCTRVSRHFFQRAHTPRNV